MTPASAPLPSRHRLALLSLVLYLMALLLLTVVLPSCRNDDMASPRTSRVDDHGGHGQDDPAGDDHGTD